MNKGKKTKVFKIIFIICFAYVSCVVFQQQLILNAKNDEMQSIEKKIDDQKKVNANLLSQKENVNSAEYIEKVSREKLGMVKDGEKIFVDVNN